jgi:hypothetical protein
MRRVSALFVAAAAMLLTAQATPPAAKDWKAVARQDVLAAYDLYVENHPGMHDPLNKGFPERLKRARDAGLRIAATATGSADYADALGAFSAELSDGHALAMAKQGLSSAPLPREWPGFVAAWRGDRLLVHHAAAGAPAPIGSTIVACNGLPAADFIRKRLAYRGFRPNETGHWWARASQAFWSTPISAAGRPERCTFRTPDGQEREAALTYSAAPADFATLLTLASDGERTPIGLSEPRQSIFVIGMPDFQPNEEGVKAYRALYETLRARRPELSKARAVVIDLRHNNGGSSSWSWQGAQALWGDEAFDQRIEDYFKNVRIWWRASKDNAAYMSEMEAQIRAAGNTAFADNVRANGEGMKAALAKGEPFHVEGQEKAGKVWPKQFVPTDFKTPVYVITPGRCASACLDALDAFKRFNNVKLIGAPTSGDSTYMEVRVADLPSGEGRIVIPNKVWMQRPRGSGEVYRPDIELRDLDWSTANFLDRIERDLAVRR